MTGLRERKKEQTRRRIAEVALRMFAERGFEAVTVNEIAEAAEVAKVTLFKYFPTKESLVLRGVGEEDLAGIVAGRPPGHSPLEALRAHCMALVASSAVTRDMDELVARVQVILGSPALRAGAGALLYRQRRALAKALAEEHEETVAALMAAQITACLHTVQEEFFQRLAAGAAPEAAYDHLAGDVKLAFDLLEHGIGPRSPRLSGGRPGESGGR
ncbi:TetR family transcriptional regulator [Planobispora siamensis]|uniref:TetR family transcriptional regulator n=1 Tax=Planobispora siamensis TaxID=936338 RepID=A0A8J3SCT5_9ACTN|nr:TetR family transcriptional regulator [Planobispora siamensis]GIH91763.1 TetR family transcriptional regulator [Planobispora siamensis]